MSSTKKRLFVAIGLPDEIKSKLEEVQKQLRRFAIDAKWVKPEGIHLTLKFLGYVEEDKLLEINRVLSNISLHYSFYRNHTHARAREQEQEQEIIRIIHIRGIGFFPNPHRPNVLWAGLECEGLSPLQQEIENEMARIGFEKENRAFSPHLTLARFREPKGLSPLAQEVEKWKQTTLGEFQPIQFSLYESVLHPHGAKYTILRSFPLTEKQ